MPYESILVSSVQSGLYAARARIFNSYTWLRGYNDKNSFLQIGNGIDEYLFTAIATQGHLTMGQPWSSSNCLFPEMVYTGFTTERMATSR